VATLTILDLDDELHDRLRVRASERGHSIEVEAREILRQVLPGPPAQNRLGSRIHQRFAAIGGAELDLPARADLPEVRHSSMRIGD
jgi:antitoxin FitA